MRVTSKGQVTIPKDVRDDLGLSPGSETDFERNERGEYVIVNLDARRNESSGERMVRIITEFGHRMRREGERANLTTDEVMEMTRGYSEDGNDPGFKRPS
jgi:AbrB family looped-hinge helix DNA binding protein